MKTLVSWLSLRIIENIALSKTSARDTVNNSIASSGIVTETVNVPVPEFPAASVAVAVQTLVTFSSVVGAVNVSPENIPPFVQVTDGPSVTPTLSVAVNVEFALSPDLTLKLDGLKVTAGEVVSAAGGGGTFGLGLELMLELELPPPQP